MVLFSFLFMSFFFLVMVVVILKGLWLNRMFLFTIPRSFWSILLLLWLLLLRILLFVIPVLLNVGLCRDYAGDYVDYDYKHRYNGFLYLSTAFYLKFLSMKYIFFFFFHIHLWARLPFPLPKRNFTKTFTLVSPSLFQKGISHKPLRSFPRLSFIKEFHKKPLRSFPLPSSTN